MRVPEGFRAQVFAAEPDIRQPVAACFDERGRLWVIEYLQYPKPAGLKPVSVDQYLRTEYDRVPPPPPHGPRGADRIKILEDSDGDGRADRVKTFVEGLNLASGLAVGHGGVFVGQAPYLLFYPDRDRDDRPDGDPEVLLTGFGLQDAHATVNSLAWGPDGWLYGAQGSTVTANIRGIGFQQGIWRYHPRTKAFELFAEGGGNTWGLDFDRGGNAFGSSNGAFVTFHMVQGGYFWKGFAKHGPLHNARTYGYFDSVEYEGQKHGGHVTPGGIIYKGDSFPPEFRGAFIGGNLLANAVYWHKLEPKGSTFKARHGGTLINARDSWFRPIDLVTGPDGSVYVVDWYDKRASHLDPRDNWDKSNGRIYKISYGAPRVVEVGDLSRLSSSELVALRTRENDWFPDMARRILAERRDAGVVPELRAMLAEDRDEALALRDLWALEVSGGIDDATALGLLEHPVAGVRRWVIRLLGDDARMTAAIHSRLLRLAREEPDVTVRSQLASSCQRWKAGDALPILGQLITHGKDRADPHIPLLLWWAFERQLRSAPDDVVEVVAGAAREQRPLVGDAVLERLARALAAEGTPHAFKECNLLFASAHDRPAVDRLVAGMDKGLEGGVLASVPPELESVLTRLLSAHELSTVALRLAVRLGSDDARRRALARLNDAGTDERDRALYATLLGQSRSPDVAEALFALIGASQPHALRTAAIEALGGFDRPEVAQGLVARYADLPEPLRDRVRSLLCARRAWADRLLSEIEAGRIAAQDLRPAQALQLAQISDPALTARLEAAWGRVPVANSAEKQARIAEVRGILPEGDKGDPRRGVAIFKEKCAACHRLFGEGETIGPDLTGAERGNLEFLLASIVDPSALIRKEYQAQTVALRDGRVLNGLVIDENERTITVVDSKPQRTVVAKADVEEAKSSMTSVMPEGVLDGLRDDQVRDLFRYLQSSGPPGQ
jgi:putative membrane-bound dehydrogenase-like protein